MSHGVQKWGLVWSSGAPRPRGEGEGAKETERKLREGRVGTKSHIGVIQFELGIKHYVEQVMCAYIAFIITGVVKRATERW